MTFWEKFGNIVIDYQKNYWNNYFPKTNIYYPARPNLRMNISQILNVPDNERKEMEQYFKDLHPTWFNLKDDAKVVKALKWVTSNVKYIGDFKKQQKPEFWQYGYQTFKDKSGDCEDGSFLMHFICIILGVPAWRLRLIAQDVIYKGSTAGHCFLAYLTRGNYSWAYDWFVCDWCYYPRDSLRNFKNVAIRELKMYNPHKNPIWWTFNSENEWSQHSWKNPYKKQDKAKDLVLDKYGKQHEF